MSPPSPRVDTAAPLSASSSAPPSAGPVVAAWRRDLRIGQYVDAQDDENVWREAVVVGLTDKNVRVHYRGFPTNRNKLHSLLSPRVAPGNSRIKPWRAFKKGDLVQVATVRYDQKDLVWSNATVERVKLKNEQTRIRVQFQGHGEKRWMDAESEFVSKRGTHETFTMRTPRDERASDDAFTSGACGDRLPQWRLSLRGGSEVEIADPHTGLWYEGRVTDLTRSQVCVRYRGWPWRYDDWLPLDSPRLAKPHTNLGEWRAFKVGQELQIGFRAKEHADHASVWVQGIVTKRSLAKTSQKLVRVEIQWDDATGAAKREWRDADDDFLAPVGVETYPLPKKTRASAAVVPPPPTPDPPVMTGHAAAHTIQVNALEPVVIQPSPRVVAIGSRDQLVEQLKRKMVRMAEDFAELQTLFEHVQSTCTCHRVETPSKRARSSHDE